MRRVVLALPLVALTVSGCASTPSEELADGALMSEQELVSFIRSSPEGPDLVSASDDELAEAARKTCASMDTGTTVLQVMIETATYLPASVTPDTVSGVMGSSVGLCPEHLGYIQEHDFG